MNQNKHKYNNKRRLNRKKALPNWGGYVIPYEGLLSKTIIGQPKAISELSKIMASHAIRTDFAIPVQAARCLIVGSPSSGKTFSVDQVAKILNLTTTAVNCSALSPPGYKGYDISTALKSVIHEAGLGGQNRAEQNSCLIFDEFDKLKRRGQEDTFIRQLEFALLPIFNGEKVLVESDEFGEPAIQFSTYNTLIFAMGVFPEIPKKHWNNIKSARSALVKYGFSPELVSRITHFIYLENLKQKDCELIINREIDLLKSVYQTNEFVPSIRNCDLKRIAKSALTSPFGVRGARVEINQLLASQAEAKAIEFMI